MKNPFVFFADWYIQKYHSKDYVHISQIKDEIKTRIENAEKRLNDKHEIDMLDAIDSLKEKHEIALNTITTKHQIETDGYIAEIESMQKLVAETRIKRKQVEDMHNRVIERAQIISPVLDVIKNERINLMNEISSGIGMIEKSQNDADAVNKEIEKSKEKDEEALKG